VTADVLILGAGVAGLSCARALSRAGKTVQLLERSRGVGGRCATRRVAGQSVDHGVAFLHGGHTGFMEAVRAVSAERIDGWPSIVLGKGTPCQPRAFTPGESRVAFVEGVSAFPKSLAVGLDVVLETDVTGLEVGASSITVFAEQRGESVRFSGRDVVLALAGPQAAALLATAASSRERDGALSLLSMMPSVPCATVIAVYRREQEPPPWHMWFPETSESLHLISHDSAKRHDPPNTILVLQAGPAWSRHHLASDEAEWASRMLLDAAKLIGRWAERPASIQVHRWKHARTGPESELASPLVLGMGRGCRLGLAGELCAPSGGVQAAWQSGELLARRLLDEATA